MTPGTFVLYRLNAADINLIKFRRARAVGWAGEHEIKAGQEFPALVMGTVGVGILDLRVFLNGNDDLWRPNVPALPPRVDADPAELNGTWRDIPAEAPAPEQEPAERMLNVNPGDAPRVVKTRKEAANG